MKLGKSRRADCEYSSKHPRESLNNLMPED